jgi:hypothetical protein
MRTWTAGEAGEGFWLNDALGAVYGDLGSGQHDDAQEAHLKLGWTEELYSRNLIYPDVPPPALSWQTENESPDVGDHVDDFGNTPMQTIGGWTRPGRMGTAGSDFGDPVTQYEKTRPWSPQSGPGEEQGPQHLAPFVPGKTFWDRVTPGSSTKPSEFFGGSDDKFEVKPGKTFWDRVTPGPSETPGEMFEEIKPSDLIKPLFPVPGFFAEGIEKVAPDVKKAIPAITGLTSMLPLIMIMMISKEK